MGIRWFLKNVCADVTLYIFYYFCIQEIHGLVTLILCVGGQFSKYNPPGGLYLEGRFNGGFFALPVWGHIFGVPYFRNFTVYMKVI